MKSALSWKRRAVVGCAVYSALGLGATILTFSRPGEAATGDVRASFSVPSSTYAFGRGMAFDCKYLYYTLEDDPNIYKVTTTGSPVQTIPVDGGSGISKGGPLAWDGSALWTINYVHWSTASGDLLRLNPANGNIWSSCNIPATNPSDPAVTSVPPVTSFPDGLDWTGDQFVLSSADASWVVFLKRDCSITSEFNPPVVRHAGAGRLRCASAPAPE